jgi:hypothetical protein
VLGALVAVAGALGLRRRRGNLTAASTASTGRTTSPLPDPDVDGPPPVPPSAPPPAPAATELRGTPAHGPAETRAAAARPRPRRRARLALVGALVVVLGGGAAMAAHGLESGSRRAGAAAREVPAVTAESSATVPAGATTSAPPPATTTTTTVPPLPEPYSRALQAENARPGTDAWRIAGAQTKGAIEGYADHVSAQHRDTVRLFVSTVAARFHVEAYRMGWYQGHVARLVWTSPPLPGTRQAAFTVTSKTNMVETRWKPSLTLQIPTSWFPGVYLVKLVGNGGQQSYVPLTVRDDSSHAAIVVLNAVTTWQAYNTYGGDDLYTGVASHGRSGFAYRSRIVSFDRPYALGDGASDFLGNELPFVVLAERLGLDLTYITDVDLHARPSLVQHHRLLVSMGHDEYWSPAMRDGAEAARDHGTSIMFLGANAVNRRIRLESSPLGPNRHEVAYKDAGADPMRKVDPSQVTVDWRQPPDPRPESSLLGEQYECNPVRADWVVAMPDSWIFTGTGLHKGDHLDTTVGTEYDHYSRDEVKPPGVTQIDVVAHSPLHCRGRASSSDATLYVAPSGATVFDSGTNWWVSKLVFGCPTREQPCVADAVRRITANLLVRLGAGVHAPVPQTMPPSFPPPTP